MLWSTGRESPAHAVPRDDLPLSLVSPVGYDDSGTNMHWQSTGQISQKARAATYRPHQARPEREATYRQRSRNKTCKRTGLGGWALRHIGASRLALAI